MIHVTSPGACNVFDYGKYLGKYIALFAKFLGVILVVFGVAFLWKGYQLFKGLRWILIGTLVWCAVFGVAYNLFPTDKLDMTTFFIMLGVSILIAVIATILLDAVVEKLLFPIMCGYLGAVILVLACGLLK